MKTTDFIHHVRAEEVSAAIRAAELRTSGEIRVFVSRQVVEDPVVLGRKEFERLGMTATKERNGVLIFVAPASQTFAVVGDSGIHEKCGEPFWKELTDAMSSEFRDARFTEGIVLGVQRAGELLARHFPRRPDDRNELPDKVERDP
jgi:uncharacterized membrane protein